MIGYLIKLTDRCIGQNPTETSNNYIGVVVAMTETTLTLKTDRFQITFDLKLKDLIIQILRDDIILNNSLYEDLQYDIDYGKGFTQGKVIIKNPFYKIKVLNKTVDGSSKK